MCNIDGLTFFCKICAKNVQDKDKTVQCDLCELWIILNVTNLII